MARNDSKDVSQSWKDWEAQQGGNMARPTINGLPTGGVKPVPTAPYSQESSTAAMQGDTGRGGQGLGAGAQQVLQGGKTFDMNALMAAGQKLVPTITPTTTMPGADTILGQGKEAGATTIAGQQAAGVATVKPPKATGPGAASTTTASAAQTGGPQQVTAQEYQATQVDPSAVDAVAAQTGFKPTPEAAQAEVNKDAMVQNQMSELLQGLQGGNVPQWAQPAVAQVDAMLAARGMSRSSIGQAELSNAIIQAAMPMAQQNAQTVQQTHMQNLANTQQANMLKSQLETQVNLANLSNEQQAAMQNAQMQHASMLSNQAADNAAKQFNASNKTQVDTFMANLKSQIEMSNTAQVNAMSQFNAAQKNAMEQFNKEMAAKVEQFNVGAELDAGKFNAAQQNAMGQFNAQLSQDADKFNAAQKQQSDMFNAQNAQAVQAANLEWRRKVSTMQTEMMHQTNMQNAQNQFGMNMSQLNNMWQVSRDYASWAWQSGENQQSRELQKVLAGMNVQAGKENANIQADAASNAGWASAIGAITAAAVTGFFQKD